MKKGMIRRLRSLVVWVSNTLAILLLIPFLLVILANQVIIISSEGYLYDSTTDIPYNHAGLILGTSHRLRDGNPNPYFHNRMKAAADLYHQQKVRYLIVSGDNRTRWYNEPEKMREELLNLGVPDSIIYLDYAGLRTLDSVVRCKKVFGQDSFTIISQKFHNQRAVYIARQHGLNTVALNANDPDGLPNARLQIREWFAKVNVFLDQLMKKQPQYTGERIIIGT
jgi:SanA protein